MAFSQWPGAYAQQPSRDANLFGSLFGARDDDEPWADRWYPGYVDHLTAAQMRSSNAPPGGSQPGSAFSSWSSQGQGQGHGHQHSQLSQQQLQTHHSQLEFALGAAGRPAVERAELLALHQRAGPHAYDGFGNSGMVFPAPAGGFHHVAGGGYQQWQAS